MKPATFTSDVDNIVGAPWEIYRAPSNRVSFVYSKEGDVGLYSSIVALLPDYDVGFTVLAAGTGSHGNVEFLTDIVGQAIYPALGEVAKAEAQSAYDGTYTVSGSSNSSIVIATDSGPGLSVTKWSLDGVDVFPALAALGGSQITKESQLSLQLYSTGLKNTKAGRTVAAAWRAVAEVVPYSVDPGAFSHNCETWAEVDIIVYGLYKIDQFVSELDSSGKASSIEPKVLQGAAYSKSKAKRSRVTV